MSVLVIDVGSSSVRASEVSFDGQIKPIAQISTPPLQLGSGVVEIDAMLLKRSVLEVAEAALAVGGDSFDGLAVANQRASAILWDHQSGDPIANGISWQDLRTVSQCLILRTQGIEVAPNETATKYQYLINQHRDKVIQPRLGTIDSFVCYVLSGGDLHVTDLTNAAMTGLVKQDGSGYDVDRIDQLGLEFDWLARIVPNGEVLGQARALSRPLPILATVGDQQASLFGQGCVNTNSAKLTLGTGAMLDFYVGEIRPSFARKGPMGCFPVALEWDGKRPLWGVEAIGLSAGSTIDWMVSTLGLAVDVGQTEGMAQLSRDDDNAIMVPSLSGQGAPIWDFGARGAFFGLGRTTSINELFRAAFRGISNMSADLLQAAESDTGQSCHRLCVDGKMISNRVVVEELSAACGIEIALSTHIEATTLGAGFLGMISLGELGSLTDISQIELNQVTVAPKIERGSQEHDRLRQRWVAARDQSLGEIPELSIVSF